MTPALNLLENAERSVKLEPRAMDLLVYFAGHAGEVISTDEAMAHVWRGRVVEDGALYKRVNQLRKALGDDSRAPSFIETVPKRGYRLIADVDPLEPGMSAPTRDLATELGLDARDLPEDSRLRSDHAPRQRALGLYLGGGVLAVAAAIAVTSLVDRGPAVQATRAPDHVAQTQREALSVAVLPFAEGRTAEADLGSLAVGIHAEILSHLRKIRALKVVSPRSVMSYASERRDLRAIGQDLGVAAVVDAIIQRAGERIRISVSLSDTETDDLIWAEQFDGELDAGNLFAVQTEIAMSIAEALGAVLSHDELRRLREPPTQNARAYALYLSGKAYEERGSNPMTDVPLAIQQYERAVGEDPGFALAWAGLSRMHGTSYGMTDSSDKRRADSLEAVQTALRLAPDLPEAHLAMAGYRLAVELDFEAALQELALAEQVLSEDAATLGMRASLEWAQGRWEQALSAYEQAIDLDPNNPRLLIAQGNVYLTMRRYADAEAHYDRALLIAPDSDDALLHKARIPAFRDGDWSLVESLAHSPLLDPERALRLAWTHALWTADYAKAFTRLDAIKDRRGPLRPWDRPIESYYGLTYELAGRTAEARRQFEIAREQLERALETRPDNPRHLVALAEALVRLGEPEQAVSLAQRAIASAQDVPTRGILREQAVRLVFMPAGAIELGIETLDQYLGAHGGVLSIGYFSQDPRLDTVRDDPRFVELIRKYRRPDGDSEQSG